MCKSGSAGPGPVGRTCTPELSHARARHRHSQSAPLPCPARPCWPPSQPVIHYVRAQHGPETRAPSGTDGRSEFIYKIVTTLNSESKWERTRDGPGQPIWLNGSVKRATSPQRRHFYKVGKRYSALSYTEAFGWSQKHFLVDPSFFFFFPFFSQISSLHHVQLLFAYSWLKYYIYFR
jgi:hypothetical protein